VIFSQNRGYRLLFYLLELLLAVRRSGVARRWKRHHSNGDNSNAAESNGIATAVARGSRQ